jgi:tetraacyldisaccharide 4'-kinase
LNPLGTLYGLAAGTRNRLYDRALLKARRLVKPVISVGNISLGGSGKTPFVILLGELLRARGVSCSVLSRGYGRRRSGVWVVDPGGRAEDFGDEPLLISRRLACPVVVGESRYEAGLLAEKQFACDLHLVDDGFQHRSLARDFDIVMLACEDLSDDLVPGGRLREPLSALGRADAVVANFEPAAGLLASRTLLWRIERGISVSEPPARAVAFCGIARPHRFMDELQALGVQPTARRFYGDHHHYGPADIDELIRIRQRTHAQGFITTEKDAINVGPEIARLGRVAVARVRMQLTWPADALDTMLQRIEEQRTSAVRKSW